jgi:hypothetical protein
MKAYPNNYRHYDYGRWEAKKNQPYDYARHGFFKHIMSHKIIESENETLQYLLKYLENSFIMVMKFVERLQHFKDYAYTNR